MALHRLKAIADRVYQGEMDFAAVKGMNVFAAIIMLCQEDLTMQDVLNMSPKQRLDFFGPFIGVDRVVCPCLLRNVTSPAKLS